MKIAIATGYKQLNDDLIELLEEDTSIETQKVHFRSFLIESEVDLIVLSPHLEEKVFDAAYQMPKLLLTLKEQGKRIVLLAGYDKELIEVAIKYAIHDIIDGDVYPKKVVDVIHNPLSFNDIKRLVVVSDKKDADTSNFEVVATKTDKVSEETIIDKPSSIPKKETVKTKKAKKPNTRTEKKYIKPAKIITNEAPEQKEEIVPKLGDTFETFKSKVLSLKKQREETRERLRFVPTPTLPEGVSYKMALTGSVNRVGVTHTALMLGFYYGRASNKVALMNRSGNLESYKYLEKFIKGTISKKPYFSIYGVDIYKEPTFDDLSNASDKYQVIIYDVGTDIIYDNVNKNLIDFCDKKFLVIDSASYNKNDIIEFSKEHQDFNRYTILMPMATASEVKEMKKFLGLDRIYNIPFCKDYTKKTEEATLIFNQITNQSRKG
jgi:hypothetical protein